jgi:pyruvate kinase
MIDAGMNILRMQLSSTNRRQHSVLLDYFKETLAQRPHKKCQLMVEIRGRSPTATHFADEEFVRRERGDDIEIKIDASGRAVSSEGKIYLTTAGLERVVRNGDLCYFDNTLKCSVVDVSESCFTVRAKEDGIIRSGARIVLPEKHQKLPIIKEEDITDLENISKMHKIDFISVPFTSSRLDIAEVEKELKKLGLENTVILARIDDRRGLDEFWEVCNTAGGIILNRLNLSYSVSSEKLFALIRFFTEQCNLMAKPLIIDSEVIESYERGLSCLRSEIADLQNAMMEGIDVIMLGRETSHSSDPIGAINAVASIVAESERMVDGKKRYR